MSLQTHRAEVDSLKDSIAKLEEEEEKLKKTDLRIDTNKEELRELRDVKKNLREQLLEVRRQITVIMQDEQAAKAEAAEQAASQVSQKGSLREGAIFVDVILQYGDRTMAANLLVDTGCNLTLNISEYKAAQLGLPDDGQIVDLQMGQGRIGQVMRRKPILVKLRLKSETDEVLEDPCREASMYVWTDVGSRDVAGSQRDKTMPDHDLLITADTEISPIKNGVDSCGHDAILGSQGMHLLNVGIDRKAGKLYIKKVTSVRKLGHHLPNGNMTP